MTPDAEGARIRSAADIDEWLEDRSAAELAEPFTFVVDADGVLRLAPRRSEHVVCAGGGRVYSAGEMAFERTAAGWAVTESSNQSAGYCPDTDTWPAVAASLDRAGIGHPDAFSHEVVFRRCPSCHERSIVHESAFVCAFCSGELPEQWNVDITGWVES
ncbi:MAG TPA: hypothetical protein VGX23_28615 [Actinocrinis sp.]|nr:hypothetical protein [Actinocrinis sp.]